MTSELSINSPATGGAIWKLCVEAAARRVSEYRSQCPSGFDPQAGTSVEAPPGRDYGQETSATLAAQTANAPAQYASEALHQPQYADLQRQILQTTLQGNQNAPGLISMLEDQLNPALNRLTSSSNLSQRTDDITAVEQLGGRATAAFKAANPQQAALMDELNNQAMSELQMGATLDPSLRREVQQGVRGAQAARGFGFGGNDAFEEAMGTGLRAEQLRASRRGFATQMAGMNAATNADPFSAVLGRSGAPAAAAGLLGQGQQQSQLGGNQLFNPESGYAQDIFNTNYNANAAANISSANNKSALIGAGISAAGSIGKNM